MRHKDWLAKWMTLARQIELTPLPTVEKLDEWTRQQNTIEADCTLEMRALQADCYNRTVRAMNLEEVHNYRLRWWHRRFCQVVRFEHAFEDVND